jgi:hypothetical protein
MRGNERRCESCGVLLARTSRPDRRFCSPACRQSAYAQRRGSRSLTIISPAEQTEIARILASAIREERLVLEIAAAAANGQWRASAWLLERRWPVRWGRPEKRTAVEVVPDGPNALDDLFAEIDEIRARRERRADERRRRRRELFPLPTSSRCGPA